MSKKLLIGVVLLVLIVVAAGAHALTAVKLTPVQRYSGNHAEAVPILVDHDLTRVQNYTLDYSCSSAGRCLQPGL